MDFIPEKPKVAEEVPYFEDVTSEGGWQGHRTEKSIDRLKSEVTESLVRLGAVVRGIQRGTFVTGKRKRDGFRIHYYIAPSNGTMVPGQLDIAALPVRNAYGKKTEQSLKMALYMVKIALDGAWFLQQLSPGYAPLMPWLLADENKTVSQLWAESNVMRNLLPPGGSDFEEGEYKEL